MIAYALYKKSGLLYDPGGRDFVTAVTRAVACAKGGATGGTEAHARRVPLYWTYRHLRDAQHRLQRHQSHSDDHGQNRDAHRCRNRPDRPGWRGLGQRHAAGQLVPRRADRCTRLLLDRFNSSWPRCAHGERSRLSDVQRQRCHPRERNCHAERQFESILARRTRRACGRSGSIRFIQEFHDVLHLRSQLAFDQAGLDLHVAAGVAHDQIVRVGRSDRV